MLTLPRDDQKWASELNAELLQRAPTLLGWRHSGTDTKVRFRAALATPWVRVHVQTLVTGGEDYNPTTSVSSTEVECRAARQQDITITGVTRFIVFLIPVQKDAAGTVILYDGQSGRPDNMAFIDTEV